MFSILATRTSRSSLAVIAIVTLPLCLVSCASPPTQSAPAAELRADTESNLLSVPAEQTYEVTDVELIAPTDTAAVLGEPVKDIDPTGYMVMHDGVITDAEFSVSVAGAHEASFVLTEPTVLRREGRDDSAVYVTGTLTVEGVEQRDTQLKLTPSLISEEAAEFDVSFTVPATLFVAESASGLSEITAHISLAAEDKP